MLEAGIFAAIAQAALIVGAVLVWRFGKLTRPAVVSTLMAFGAGAVISAVGTDLVAVSYKEAGAGATALGIGIGCLGYFTVISLLERGGASEKPEKPLEEAEGGEVGAASPTEARNLFVGMLVDGVPESVAVGLTLHLGSIGVSAALVGSIFIAGLPEAIGVAAALLAGGYSLAKILTRFGVVVIVGALAGMFGYRVLYGQSDELIALIQAIAAGALLVVVVNEMVPIAIRGIGRWAGVVASCGFVFSAGLTWISGG